MDQANQTKIEKKNVLTEPSINVSAKANIVAGQNKNTKSTVKVENK
jgi:hypothetical protein